MTLNNEWKDFWGTTQDKVNKGNTKWSKEPVTPKEFFKYWVDMELFPRQQKALDAMFDKRTNMLSTNTLEFVLAWGKGCLCGDTEMYTRLGRYTLAELNKINLPLVLQSYADKNIETISTPAIKKPEKERCYLVKTKLGQKYKAAENHRFLMSNKEYKYLKDIKCGDKLLAPEKTQFFFNIQTDISSYEAKLLGYLIGDGCTRGDTKIQIFVGKPEIVKDIKFLCNKIGISVRDEYHNGKDNRVLHLQRKDTITRNSNKAVLLCKKYGIYDCLAKDKRIHSDLLQADFLAKKALIEGLWNSDGWFSSNGKWGFDVGYVSKNRKLIEDINQLLLQFGIVGTISEKYTKYNGEKRTYHQIKIRQMKYVKRFLDTFNLLGKDKYIKKAKEYFKDKKYNYTGFITDTIKSITPIGEQVVYTFTVPKTQNYLCGMAYHHNSGKDLVVANLLNYCIYLLCCLNNPQDSLGLKSGEPIDIVNVAFDDDQARSVFFDKFIRAVKNTIDPHTGKNFYEALGMDIDKNILKNSVLFPYNIRAWSLNSKEHKAEGKNILLGIFDEIGSFRFDHAEKIRKHIRTSAKTRFPKLYKMIYISFLSSPNDYMAYLIDRAEQGQLPKCYFDRAATWDVRSGKNCSESLKKFVVNKDDYQDDYDEDPGTAMLMYECKIPRFRSNNFIKKADKILACINHKRTSPLIIPDEDENEDYLRCWTHNILEEEFEGWFKPGYTQEIYNLMKEYETEPNDRLAEKIKEERERHAGAQYHVHIDLSRGVVDCAGIVMAHDYYVLDQKKVYVDLMLQVRAPKRGDSDSPKEIDLNDILDFVIKVLYKRMKFPIVKITADGWNSQLFLNICEKNGIDAETISLERNTAPYDTLKDVIYSENIDYYNYSPTIRELTELIVNEKNKIDHPSKSQWRLKEEGLPRGSKDIADCLAGVVMSIMQDTDGEPLAMFTIGKRRR